MSRDLTRSQGIRDEPATPNRLKLRRNVTILCRLTIQHESRGRNSESGAVDEGGCRMLGGRTAAGHELCNAKYLNLY